MTSCRCSPAPGSRRDCSGRFLLTRAARRPFSALAAACSACRWTTVSNGPRLMRPISCSRAASWQLAETSRALTMTCGESSKFSLVSLRSPSPALTWPEEAARGHAPPPGHGKALRPRSGSRSRRQRKHRARSSSPRNHDDNSHRGTCVTTQVEYSQANGRSRRRTRKRPHASLPPSPMGAGALLPSH